jgi:glutathione S-transferase
MITLYKFGPFLGAPDSSPFVIKTMMLLKLSGLAFRETAGNPLRAPQGLLPYIEDDGAVIADSTFIRFHIETTYKFDFDSALTATQKAMAWATERMCEDHLYFAMLESRWLDRRNFRRGVGKMFGVVPFALRPIAKSALRRANAKRLTGHGIGRHPKARIADLGNRDLSALSAILGDKPYLMGDTPCGADATVFGFVTSILTPPLDSPMRTAAMAMANLVAYRDRLTTQYFPDTEKEEFGK